ncbi:MAG: CHAP domain-containing protein [Sporichthyaceae bacterium]
MRTFSPKTIGWLSAMAVCGTVPLASSASAAPPYEVVCKRTDFGCTTGGYGAQDLGWPDREYGQEYERGLVHNCTRYAAFQLSRRGLADPGRTFGHAHQWDDTVRSVYGASAVNSSPLVGAIAQWDSFPNDGGFGHVAYVEEVGTDFIKVTDDAYGGGTSTRIIPRGSMWPHNFIQLKSTPAPTKPPAPQPSLAQYRNTIVKQVGDSRTSWFVTPDLKRLWIPDGGTFNQLRARGFALNENVSTEVLKRLPDQASWWVASGAAFTDKRSLRRDMHVRSSDGRYTFVLQGDGNLVLYGPSGRAIWSTDVRASGWRDQVKVKFSAARGTLATYAADGRRIWESGGLNAGGDRFVVQSDGNLVIYAGSKAVWASNTAGRN